MIRTSSWIAICALFCALFPLSAQSKAKFFKRYQLKKPVRTANLAVFPVVTRAKTPALDKFLLLGDGLKENLVLVKESGATVQRIVTRTGVRLQTSSGGRVSQVLVSNLSDKELFIMGGEVILGGKQDRVVQKDLLIPPKTNNHPVAVFCVEKGRWRGNTVRFRGGKHMVDMKLRSKAMFGDQSKVWKEVNRKNALMKTKNPTDTYRAVLKSGQVQKKIATQLAAVLGKLNSVNGLTGVVVAINGDVKAVDVFYSPHLFKRVMKKVLRSYILEALTHPKKGKLNANLKHARKFIITAEKTKLRQKKLNSKSSVYTFDSSEIQGLKLRRRGKKPTPTSPDVHYNYYKK